MLVPFLWPKQPWPFEARTPLDPWSFAVVSDTKVAADPLSSRFTDARLNWHVGNLGTKSASQTHCSAPQTIPEPFLLCGTVHCPGCHATISTVVLHCQMFCNKNINNFLNLNQSDTSWTFDQDVNFYKSILMTANKYWGDLRRFFSGLLHALSSPSTEQHFTILHYRCVWSTVEWIFDTTEKS